MRIRAIGMHFIYCESLTDAHPSIFLAPCRFSRLQPFSFPPPCLNFPSRYHYWTLTAHMIPAQIRCRGCDKVFTPRGLSQHTSKTQNVRCHTISNPPLDQFGSPSILRAVSRSALSPNHTPGVISDDQPGDEYRTTTDQGSDDVANLDDVSSDGAYFTAHVPNQGGVPSAMY
jgi:hypothetical protein